MRYLNMMQGFCRNNRLESIDSIFVVLQLKYSDYALYIQYRFCDKIRAS